MNAKHIYTIITILLGLLLVILVLPNFNPPAALAQGSIPHALAFQQLTPTPQAGDVSEIGSTDGILVMGFVIVLIVTLPLIFRKKM